MLGSHKGDLPRQAVEDRAGAQKVGAVFHAKVRCFCCVYNADFLISIGFDDDLGHVHTGSSTCILLSRAVLLL